MLTSGRTTRYVACTRSLTVRISAHRIVIDLCYDDDDGFMSSLFWNTRPVMLPAMLCSGGMIDHTTLGEFSVFAERGRNSPHQKRVDDVS